MTPEEGPSEQCRPFTVPFSSWRCGGWTRVWQHFSYGREESRLGVWHFIPFHSRRRFLLPSSQFGAKYNKQGTKQPFVYFGSHNLNVTDMLKKAFKDNLFFFFLSLFSFLSGEKARSKPVSPFPVWREEMAYDTVSKQQSCTAV